MNFCYCSLSQKIKWPAFIFTVTLAGVEIFYKFVPLYPLCPVVDKLNTLYSTLMIKSWSCVVSL